LPNKNKCGIRNELLGVNNLEHSSQGHERDQSQQRNYEYSQFHAHVAKRLRVNLT